MKNFPPENPPLEPEVKKYLLTTARNSIGVKLGEAPKPLNDLKAKILDEKRGVFVTLEIDGQLRGCIGDISPVFSLREGVHRNAINAAFKDPRFPPLSPEEFKKISIEISVLTPPRKLPYSSSADLLKKLVPLKHGVILDAGYTGATYLPQVWEQLPDKESFLSSLCMKAGLPADEWRNGELSVSIYEAEVFGEENL